MSSIDDIEVYPFNSCVFKTLKRRCNIVKQLLKLIYYWFFLNIGEFAIDNFLYMITLQSSYNDHYKIMKKNVSSKIVQSASFSERLSK